MPSGIVNGPGDGQRLARQRKTRRRNKALHRAFLHPTRHITLSRTRRTSHGTLTGRRRWSSNSGSSAKSWTRSGSSRARRMRSTTFSRPHGRTSLSRGRSSGTRPLKNRLAAFRHDRTRRGRAHRPRRRRVNRTRPGLRHDQPSRRRSCRTARRSTGCGLLRVYRACRKTGRRRTSSLRRRLRSRSRRTSRSSHARRRCYRRCRRRLRLGRQGRFCLDWQGRRNRLRFIQNSYLILNCCLGRLCSLGNGRLRRRRGRRRLRRNNDGSGRTSYRLRRNESWRGLGRLNRSGRSSAGDRLRCRRRRLRRNSRRRCHRSTSRRGLGSEARQDAEASPAGPLAA